MRCTLTFYRDVLTLRCAIVETARDLTNDVRKQFLSSLLAYALGPRLNQQGDIIDDDSGFAV
jgi:hypothetical protein